jgi:hypothetical protein
MEAIVQRVINAGSMVDVARSNNGVSELLSHPMAP